MTPTPPMSNPLLPMLDFDTCIRLKNKGFPQEIPDEYGDDQSQWWCQYGNEEPICLWCQSDKFSDDGTYGECKVLCKMPTIGDLIKELPKTQEGCWCQLDLQYDYWELEWNAGYCMVHENDHDPFVSGSTPEQALANLYLHPRHP